MKIEIRDLSSDELNIMMGWDDDYQITDTLLNQCNRWVEKYMSDVFVDIGGMELLSVGVEQFFSNQAQLKTFLKGSRNEKIEL